VIDPSEESPILYDVYKSRMILGQDVFGSLITIGQQISDVITYAISCGANLAIGIIDIPVNIPLEECKNLSCIDVIRRLLRWVSDAVCYIDYDNTVPLMSFLRRLQMSPVTLDILSNVNEFSIQPRSEIRDPISKSPRWF
jgi:hypothetical protein